MPSLALFQISIVFSLIAWGIVLARYLWPQLRHQPRRDAMQPLFLLHCFRFVGLSCLVPGVVSPDLPRLHGRDQIQYAELAAQHDGRIIGLRTRSVRASTKAS